MARQGPIRARRGTAVTGPDGTAYRSYGEAARALGFNPANVRHHWLKYGHLRLLGCGKTPCEHQGVRYDSLQDCAAAIGVRRHTLTHHLEKYGNLDRAGMGNLGGTRGNSGPRVKTRIGPMEWPSRKTAAADLGISTVSLSRWISPRATDAQRRKLRERAAAIHDTRLAEMMRAAA